MKSSEKRISFLMPYIDFCFMVIIIFVGMLSIAYFEPLGTSNIQSKQENKLDIREGKYQENPDGTKILERGIGEELPDNIIRPLVSPDYAKDFAAIHKRKITNNMAVGSEHLAVGNRQSAVGNRKSKIENAQSVSNSTVSELCRTTSAVTPTRQINHQIIKSPLRTPRSSSSVNFENIDNATSSLNENSFFIDLR